MNRRKMSWKEKGGCKVKSCKKCGEEFKPPTSGHVYCEDCSPDQKRESHAKAMREYRKRNKEHCQKVKKTWDLKKYGLTFEEYLEQLVRQGERCAICRTKDPGLKGFAVDHDHKSGSVRGLLCGRCNTALGSFKEDPNLLKVAALYVANGGVMPSGGDSVNHPKHYNSASGVECIDVVESLSFNVGNVIKYLWRMGRKGPALEDLKKAQWYIAREIQRVSKLEEDEQ